jgi:hypothetical protein
MGAYLALKRLNLELQRHPGAMEALNGGLDGGFGAIEAQHGDMETRHSCAGSP